MEHSTDLHLSDLGGGGGSGGGDGGGGGASKFDDDGRPKRTGNFWTASAHIVTAVIGSGVLSLAWAMGQLGWVAGPISMFLFAAVTYYTTILLADCYRHGDPVTGKRNYTYVGAVEAYLSGWEVNFLGWMQYVNLFGYTIGYTIAASISMVAIERSNCFHANGHESPCKVNSTSYMIIYGVIEIIFSQIPDLDQISWLSIVAAVMSFTYSVIGLALGVAQVIQNGTIKGTLTGVGIGAEGLTKRIWGSLQALGDIAFAFSFSMILVEIQDTVKAPPPSEAKVMKKATLFSVAVTTVFYLLCGSFGYAAFGDDAPGNLLTSFGFFDPYWLVNVANIAIVVHLVGAYQVYSQPLFAFVEGWAKQRWPECKMVTKEIKIPITPKRRLSLNVFRLGWRTLFVVVSTVISMIMPFFDDVAGLLGALGFWPLTVYFPVEMYILKEEVPRWSKKWVCLQMLSMACLVISVAAAVGSIVGIVGDFGAYKPFQ